MRPQAERTFTIPVSNGIFAHRERIGAAIWTFLWLIDHTTKEVSVVGGKAEGLVYNGRPVPLGDIATELAMCSNSVREHLSQLAKAGYIRKINHENGRPNGYAVVNSKRFNRRKELDYGTETPPEKRRGSDVTPPEIPQGTPPENCMDPARKVAGPRQKSSTVIKETNQNKAKHPLATVPTDTAAGDLVLTAEKEPKHVKGKIERPSDPRHVPVFRFILESYKEKNGVNCPDLKKLAGALAQFLKGCDSSWTTPDVCACITNRFDSDKPPVGEAPHRWISQLATWRNGALTAFNTLKPKAVPRSSSGQKSIAQQNAEYLENKAALLRAEGGTKVAHA
jgi:hypothetical protein